jgi:hypothetical protein
MQALQQVESFSSLNGSHVKSHETALSMAELDRADINCLAGFSYDAVWLSAIAFARLSATDAAPRENSCVMTTAEEQQGDSFFETIKSTRFTGASGDVALLSNGDRDNKTIAVSLENLLNYGSITLPNLMGDLQQTSLMKDGASFSEIVWAGTGELRAGEPLKLDFDQIVWADGTSTLPSDGVQEEREAFEWSMVLLVIPVVLMFFLLACTLLLWCNAKFRTQLMIKIMLFSPLVDPMRVQVRAEHGPKWGQFVSYMLPPVAEEEFHIFMSHVQMSGADQVAQIKSKLTRHVPGLKCFLDIDNTSLETSDLEALVARSKVLLLFLTKGIFSSFWVQQEIRAAIKAGVPIILVRETDPRHGALSKGELIKKCPEDLQEHLFGKPQQAHQDSFKRECLTVDSARNEPKNPLVPGANRSALDVLEWHRGKEFQVVSLCQIMRQLLYLVNPEKYATGPQLRRTDNTGVPNLGIDGTVMSEPDAFAPKSSLRSFCMGEGMPDSFCNGTHALTNTISTPGGSGKSVHNCKVDVYISSHCASAARLIRQMQEGACEHMSMTQGDFRDARVFVVYLERKSWESASYADDVRAAMANGATFALLQEKSEEHGAAPFSHFLDSPLGWDMQAAGLFRIIALEWHSEHTELLRVSQKLAAKAIGAMKEAQMNPEKASTATKRLSFRHSLSTRMDLEKCLDGTTTDTQTRTIKTTPLQGGV